VLPVIRWQGLALRHGNSLDYAQIIPVLVAPVKGFCGLKISDGMNLYCLWAATGGYQLICRAYRDISCCCFEKPRHSGLAVAVNYTTFWHGSNHHMFHLSEFGSASSWPLTH
jgi:hypothetical protein